MEKDPELKFVCKWCDKKYPCGKSLGGHIRTHVIAAPNSVESEEKVSALMKSEPPPTEETMVGAGGGIHNELGGPSGGYGLRENPKKTWRAVGSTFPLQQQERICKQCGKGFQSLKALCGHMACHSEKERLLKDDHSWTSEDPKLVMDGYSDTEAEDLRPHTRSKTKRYKRIVVKSSHFTLPNNSNNYGSSVTEIDEVEQEEVAICLMMLSRDSGKWGGVNSVVESSDNNSVILETKSSSIDMKIGRMGGLNLDGDNLEMKKVAGARNFKVSALDAEWENSHSGYFRNGVKKVNSDISLDEFYRCNEYKEELKGPGISDADLDTGYNRGKIDNGFNTEKRFSEIGSSSKSLKYDQKKRPGDVYGSPEIRKESMRKLLYDSSDGELSKNAHKRSKYECLNCNKTFNSHQALGGHRPCHKKANAKVSKYESGDNSLKNYISPDSTPTRKFVESISNKKQFSSAGTKKTRTKKSKGHECPICFRMFKSGQALGGHKRSHFINGSEDFNNQTSVYKEESSEIHDMIDLNLPAPEEDDADDNDHFIY